MYNELIQISHIQGPARIRYTRMQNVLKRLCTEYSQTFKGNYATLFSRLIAVCRALQIDHRPADRFRHNARMVLHGEFCPSYEEELADLADLCHFIYQLTGIAIPDELPQHIRPIRVKAPCQTEKKYLRGVITQIIDTYTFKCLPEGADIEYTITFNESKDTQTNDLQTTRFLYTEAGVMLIDVVVTPQQTDALSVYMVILEPDFLIDISALTATIKPYGNSPLNYLLNQLEPKLPTKYTLLGNMANQFMDDCINEKNKPNLFHFSALKNYRQNVLDFSCIDPQEVNNDFFNNARRQFNHIQSIIQHKFTAPDINIPVKDVLLEPSFICPTLGLRGRLDVMTTDYKRVLELKSGKAQEYYKQPIGPKSEHLLQMTLYGEILRRNFNLQWDEVHTFLLYSTYPMLYNERPSAAAIRNILQLRNGIINLTHQLRMGNFDKLLPLLTPEHLKTYDINKNFYTQYLLPAIKKLTDPLQNLTNDELLRNYITAFITFVQRELFLSKTSDNRPDSIRGFAATWTADRQTRQLAGNLLTNLTIDSIVTEEDGSISSIVFHLPDYKNDFVPNFNKGEIIQIYQTGHITEHNTQANVTNQQLIRGTVTHISANLMTITLSYPQRNHSLFANNLLFAIEHDSTDGPNNQQMRNLFALLTATPKRQDLLLARRAPEYDSSIQLIGCYPENISNIILQAKQASDYYLLVGPPGTGKTNMALRSMVKEFLLNNNQLTSTHPSANSEKNQPPSILLTAYTNRAVDEICSMLDNLSLEIPFDYLRIGTPPNCDKQHHEHLLCKRAETFVNREEAQQMIDSTQVFVGTVMTLTNQQILFKRKHFQTAIIDEASQLLEPQLLGLLCAQTEGVDAIDKFILIGDHKQLPAVVVQPEETTRVTNSLLNNIGLTNLRNSLFERLHHLEESQGRQRFIGMLNHQGRMHPDICQFVNRFFYEEQLTEVPLPHQQETLTWHHAETPYEQFVAETRMGFVAVKQTEKVENLRANAPEAEAVCNLLEAICSLHAKNGNNKFNPAQAIGIIVPFRSQIASIRSALHKRHFKYADELTIDTVECYQGSQRDYILFSTTISENYQLDIISATQKYGDYNVDRKLNVAITRARRQFFIFGDPKLLCQNELYKQLINYCHKME